METILTTFGWSIIGSSILIVWFLSDFKTHLINTLFRTELDDSNINEFIAMKFDVKILKTDFSIASLMMCPICIGFWIALVLTVIHGEMIHLAHIYFFQIFSFALVKKLMQ
jgi:hypothetical protein